MLQGKHIMHIKRALSFGVFKWSELEEDIKMHIIKQPELFSSYINMSETYMASKAFRTDLQNAAKLYAHFLHRSKDLTDKEHGTDIGLLQRATDFLPALFGLAEEKIQVDIGLASRVYHNDPDALHAYEKVLNDWDALFNALPPSGQLRFCQKRFKQVLQFEPLLLVYSSFDRKPSRPMHQQYEALKEKERIRRRVMSLYVKMRITSPETFEEVFRCIQSMQIHSVVLQTDIDKLNQEHAQSVLVDAQNIMFEDIEEIKKNKNGDVHLHVIVIKGATPLVTYHVNDSELEGVDVNMLQQVLQDKANLFIGDNCECVARKRVQVSIVKGKYQSVAGADDRDTGGMLMTDDDYDTDDTDLSDMEEDV